MEIANPSSTANKLLACHEEDTLGNSIGMSTCLDEIPILMNACNRCGKIGRRLNSAPTDICQLCALLTSNPFSKVVPDCDRLLLTGSTGEKYEISNSLLKDQDGIIVHLNDGPPDTLSMTVYWLGFPKDILILEEVLEQECYDQGVNPLLLGYADGLLFRLLEWEKFDTEDYLLDGAYFTKEAAIQEAENILRNRYAPAPGGEWV